MKNSALMIAVISIAASLLGCQTKLADTPLHAVHTTAAPHHIHANDVLIIFYEAAAKDTVMNAIAKAADGIDVAYPEMQVVKVKPNPKRSVDEAMKQYQAIPGVLGVVVDNEH